MLFTITLDNIAVHAPVGVFEEEKTYGNDFLLNLSMEVDLPASVVETDSLSGTIDYGVVAGVASEVMCNGCDLLETAAWRIAMKIMKCFDNGIIKSATVRVTKLNPPIHGMKIASSSAQVTLTSNEVSGH